MTHDSSVGASRRTAVRNGFNILYAQEDSLCKHA